MKVEHYETKYVPFKALIQQDLVSRTLLGKTSPAILWFMFKPSTESIWNYDTENARLEVFHKTFNIWREKVFSEPRWLSRRNKL